MTVTEDELLTTRELCARLKVHRSTIYRLGLHDFAVPLGGSWRFKWREIREYLDREAARPASSGSVLALRSLAGLHHARRIT